VGKDGAAWVELRRDRGVVEALPLIGSQRGRSERTEGERRFPTGLRTADSAVRRLQYLP